MTRRKKNPRPTRDQVLGEVERLARLRNLWPETFGHAERELEEAVSGHPSEGLRKRLPGWEHEDFAAALEWLARREGPVPSANPPRRRPTVQEIERRAEVLLEAVAGDPGEYRQLVRDLGALGDGQSVELGDVFVNWSREDFRAILQAIERLRWQNVRPDGDGNGNGSHPRPRRTFKTFDEAALRSLDAGLAAIDGGPRLRNDPEFEARDARRRALIARPRLSSDERRELVDLQIWVGERSQPAVRRNFSADDRQRTGRNPGRGRDEIDARYQDLVEKKHTVGLSEAERAEMDDLGRSLSEFDEPYYRPIIERLKEEGEGRANPRRPTGRARASGARGSRGARRR